MPAVAVGCTDESQVSLPWYIMTSDHTTEETIQFFRSHKFFGLPEQDVIFFEQAIAACSAKRETESLFVL